MLLKLRMRDEDIRLINYLRCRSEQALREADENGDREESEMARAVELLNRIFYGCINQKMMAEEKQNLYKKSNTTRSFAGGNDFEERLAISYRPWGKGDIEKQYGKIYERNNGKIVCSDDD